MGLGVQKETGQRLTKFCQEKNLFLVLANTLFVFAGLSKHPLPTTQEKTLHMDITRWSTPKSDTFFAAKDGEALYNQQKQDRELAVA